MSFGKMSEPCTIIRVLYEKDSDGFAQPRDEVRARVRAYYEQRHGNVRWANRAAFSEATALFRFRVIPGLSIEPLFKIESAAGRFEVLSVEVLGKRYYEVLAREVTALGESGDAAPH